MTPTRSAATSSSEQAIEERLRLEARRFVTALTSRLAELENLAQLARRFNVFSADEYTEFKQLFLNFRDLCEEFQVLSRMAEYSLDHIDHRNVEAHHEAVELDATFRALQVPMLSAMIRTNLRLVRVWESRLRAGEGMPYGSKELFRETVRIIDTARSELLRPRYLALLEDQALEDAEEADRLLKTLIRRSPTLFDFVESDAIDDELMKLIKGLPGS
jgi:cell fate (sporulation/competence/biofilm development) regulator YlbF (YheA/YmcA/DUF963 family)